MKRLVGACVFGAALFLTATVSAQSTQTPPQRSAPSATDETRPATTTTSGTTGIWYVPTSEVLSHGKWSASFYRTNFDDGQGFTDLSTFPATFAIGLGNRAELFGNWVVVTRIDRDARPLFFDGSSSTGVGGGILVDHPGFLQQWSGNKRGDLTVGGKINLLAASTSPLGAAVRAMVKLPAGDEGAGISSGKADFEVDGIVSAYNPVAEVSGYAGVLMRGNPVGYSLTNGLRWGLGAAFPQRYNLGFRVNAEIFGEHYFNDTVTAPSGLVGADGSLVPVSTRLKSPVVTSFGVTWQAPNGFFIGGAASVNLAMKGREQVGFPDTPKDDKGLHFRIGFHPGARDRTGSGGGSRSTGDGPGANGIGGPAGGPSSNSGVGGGPGSNGVGGPGAARPGGEPGAGNNAAGSGVGGPGSGAPGGPGAGGPGAGAAGAGPAGTPGSGPAGASGAQSQANRPPTVRASCNPCTVEVGRAATVSADAQDPDGDPLTYNWTNGAGTLASPTARQSAWTAPMQIGPVPFTVTVNDGRGGTASDSVTIQVVRPAQQFTFEDVHFEFDRFTLRQDALAVLDGAVTAMKADPTLRLEIEGHTCNIGTAEYNLALGDRRARAVRDYLTSRGVDPERLRAVSYGEERPKYDNSREETRRLNRRAALVVRLQ